MCDGGPPPQNISGKNVKTSSEYRQCDLISHMRMGSHPRKQVYSEIRHMSDVSICSVRMQTVEFTPQVNLDYLLKMPLLVNICLIPNITDLTCHHFF